MQTLEPTQALSFDYGSDEEFADEVSTDGEEAQDNSEARSMNPDLIARENYKKADPIACLKMWKTCGEKEETNLFKIIKGTTSIGRDQNKNDIVLDSEEISLEHVTILEVGDGSAFFITDRGSTNGTWLQLRKEGKGRKADRKRLDHALPCSINLGDVFYVAGFKCMLGGKELLVTEDKAKNESISDSKAENDQLKTCKQPCENAKEKQASEATTKVVEVNSKAASNPNKIPAKVQDTQMTNTDTEVVRKVKSQSGSIHIPSVAHKQSADEIQPTQAFDGNLVNKPVTSSFTSTQTFDATSPERMSESSLKKLETETKKDPASHIVMQDHIRNVSMDNKTIAKRTVNDEKETSAPLVCNKTIVEDIQPTQRFDGEDSKASYSTEALQSTQVFDGAQFDKATTSFTSTQAFDASTTVKEHSNVNGHNSVVTSEKMGFLQTPRPKVPSHAGCKSTCKTQAVTDEEMMNAATQQYDEEYEVPTQVVGADTPFTTPGNIMSHKRIKHLCLDSPICSNSTVGVITPSTAVSISASPLETDTDETMSEKKARKSILKEKGPSGIGTSKIVSFETSASVPVNTAMEVAQKSTESDGKTCGLETKKNQDSNESDSQLSEALFDFVPTLVPQDGMDEDEDYIPKTLNDDQIGKSECVEVETECDETDTETVVTVGDDDDDDVGDEALTQELDMEADPDHEDDENKSGAIQAMQNVDNEEEIEKKPDTKISDLDHDDDENKSDTVEIKQNVDNKGKIEKESDTKISDPDHDGDENKGDTMEIKKNVEKETASKIPTKVSSGTENPAFQEIEKKQQVDASLNEISKKNAENNQSKNVENCTALDNGSTDIDAESVENKTQSTDKNPKTKSDLKSLHGTDGKMWKLSKLSKRELQEELDARSVGSSNQEKNDSTKEKSKSLCEKNDTHAVNKHTNSEKLCDNQSDNGETKIAPIKTSSPDLPLHELSESASGGKNGEHDSSNKNPSLDLVSESANMIPRSKRQPKPDSKESDESLHKQEKQSEPNKSNAKDDDGMATVPEIRRSNRRRKPCRDEVSGPKKKKPRLPGKSMNEERSSTTNVAESENESNNKVTKAVCAEAPESQVRRSSRRRNPCGDAVSSSEKQKKTELSGENVEENNSNETKIVETEGKSAQEQGLSRTELELSVGKLTVQKLKRKLKTYGKDTTGLRKAALVSLVVECLMQSREDGCGNKNGNRKMAVRKQIDHVNENENVESNKLPDNKLEHEQEQKLDILEEEDIKRLSVVEVKNQLAKYGLSTKGLKKRLTQRLTQHMKKLGHEKNSMSHGKRKRSPEAQKSLPSRVSKKRAPMCKVLFTGFLPSNTDKRMLEKFGAVCVKESANKQLIDLECTHLILKKGKISRTLKLLTCMSMTGARSPRIVHEDWIRASAEQGKPADEAEYIPFDKKYADASGIRNFNMEESLSLRDTGKMLLKDMVVYLTKNVQPKPEELEQIVRNMGGELRFDSPKVFNLNSILLTCKKDETSVIVKRAIKNKMHVFDISWLTHGLINYALDWNSRTTS